MESKGLGDVTGFLLIIITTFMTEVLFFTWTVSLNAYQVGGCYFPITYENNGTER